MFALRSSSSLLRRQAFAIPIRRANLATDVPAQAAELTMGDFLAKPAQATSDETPPEGRGYPKSIPPSLTPSLFSEAQTEGINVLPRYRLHCRASRNNTMVQLTEPDGKTLGWFSAGTLKFKGANRASYEAGYQCAVAAFALIKKQLEKKGEIALELYFRGFGQGRDAMKTALLAEEGKEIRKLVSLIQDRTPIKIGGTRSPKARRL